MQLFLGTGHLPGVRTSRGKANNEKSNVGCGEVCSMLSEPSDGRNHRLGRHTGSSQCECRQAGEFAGDGHAGFGIVPQSGFSVVLESTRGSRLLVLAADDHSRKSSCQLHPDYFRWRGLLAVPRSE